MNTSYRLFVLAALFALGVACWLSFGSSPAQEKGKAALPDDSMQKKWEYKIMILGNNDTETEKELNKLGDEGWELVGTPSSVSAPPIGQGSSRISTRVRLIFKRPKK